jgi:GNAT superfamily N-acetyltransferase
LSAPGRVEIRTLAPSDGPLLQRLYADVLAPSFDRDELEGVDALADGLEGSGATELSAVAALDPAGGPLGVLIAERFPGAPDALLLSYLAVRPDARGRGVGTSLMRSAAAGWRADPRVLLVVGEAHDPRAWERGGDEDPVSRLRLYERLGARALGVPFVQPALDADRARVPGFLLLAFYADAAALASPEAVRSDLLSGFIRAYYLVAEGPPRPDDGELPALLRWIERRPAIALVGLDDYARVPTMASITAAP